MNWIRPNGIETAGKTQYLYSTSRGGSCEYAEESVCRQNVNTSEFPMEILTALAIAPFLAALVLGAREAELEEQNNR